MFHALDKDRTGALSNKVRGLCVCDVCVMCVCVVCVCVSRGGWVDLGERERACVRVCGLWGDSRSPPSPSSSHTLVGLKCTISPIPPQSTLSFNIMCDARQEFKEGLQGLGVLVEDSEADKTFKTLCKVCISLSCYGNVCRVLYVGCGRGGEGVGENKRGGR